MNRSMMPKQIMAYNQGGIASFVPQQTQIMGQPHRLAYVNPQEEQMMLNAGGAGLPGPGGIPAYWTLTEPSTWAGGSNYEPGAGFQGVGNFNASDNDNTSYTSDSPSGAGNNPNDQGQSINQTQGTSYSGNQSAQNIMTSVEDDNRVGFIDSIAMGLGFKEKTPSYYATTAKTIAASQGEKAALGYLNRLSEDGKITANQLSVFSDSASQNASQDLYNPTANDDDGGNNDNTVVVDDGTVDDGTVDGEEEIQYTQMKPFYGGYQPSTIASTLVPSQLTRPTGPNPRLDPVYPQLPPPDFDYNIGDGPIDNGRKESTPINNFDFGAPANLDERAALYGGGWPGLGTNVASGVPSQGQFNSLAELDAYQQQNPSLNLMSEYQRLRALSGGIPAVAQLPNRGIASIFGNEQAPQYMYQGIMG